MDHIFFQYNQTAKKSGHEKWQILDTNFVGILKIPNSTFNMYGSIYLLFPYKWTGEMGLKLILLKKL